MKQKNFKAGLFVVFTLALMIYMILKVSQGGMLFASSYDLHLKMTSAVGLGKNTPVQIAGVDVGVVKSIQLLPDNQAQVVLSIREGVKIYENAEAQVKTTGILGDAYVAIFQPGPGTYFLKDGDNIKKVSNLGDINSITGQVSAIADDVKAITATMRKLMAGDGSVFDKSMRNIEKITKSLAKVTTTNEKNIDAIVANMKALSQNLNHIVAQNMGHVNKTMYNLADITGTVAKGEGTIGKLIKDEETVDKLNESLESINNFLGGANRLKVDLGMHSEYLAGTGDFKNYVELTLRPRPDKFFLFEVVSDPDPSFNTNIEEKTVTANGQTNVVTTSTRSKRLDGLLFSAQIGKKIKDFTIRGGLIESTGGIGVDYNKGALGVSFQAFDFRSEGGQRPHLKFMGRAQVTNSFYLLGGVDDIINKNQDLAWFMGAGLTFTDDDLRSLLGTLGALNR